MTRPDTKAWEEAFFQLHEWLDDDRDRHSAVIRADNCEIWHVALYIDHQFVNAESGNDLPDTIAGAMAGMVVAERGGTEWD